jgi:hypothetical protein
VIHYHHGEFLFIILIIFCASREQNLVEALKHGAYQNIDGLQPNYKMVNNYPVLSSFPAAQGTSLFSALHPNQQALSYGDSSTGVGFGTRPSRETFNTSLGSSNVSI